MSEHLDHRDEFEQLFKNNYTRLYFYALNLVKDQEDARDIVSSAFEYLWDNYNSLKSAASPVPLLFTFIRNRCIDYIRHQEIVEKHHKYLSQEGALWMEDSYNEHDEQIVRIRKIVDNLPEQTKRVVEKCFLEGKKYKEVGEEMNISVNTVKTHVMKALRLLRGGLDIEK